MEELITSLQNVGLEPLNLPERGTYRIHYTSPFQGNQTITQNLSKEFLLGFLIQATDILISIGYIDEFVGIEILRGSRWSPIDILSLLEHYSQYNTPIYPPENYNDLLTFPPNENWLGWLQTRLGFNSTLPYTALLSNPGRLTLVAFATQDFPAGITLACRLFAPQDPNCGRLIQVHQGNERIG